VRCLRSRSSGNARLGSDLTGGRRVRTIELHRGTTGRDGSGNRFLRDAVAPTVRQDGGEGAILLIDRENGKAIGMTLWPDEATMRASEEDANRLRAQAADEIHATAPPRVERYEVAVFESF